MVAAALAVPVRHLDWQFDPLAYAFSIQHGGAGQLVPQHALGILLPLLSFDAAKALGYGGRAAPVLFGWSVAGTAGAVGLTFLAAVRLGATRRAAALAAGVLAATAVTWRAGGGGGVYGVAFATVAIGWFAAARFAERPTPPRAGVLGVGAGLAVAGHLASVAFLPAAILLMIGIRPEAGGARGHGREMLIRFAALAVLTVAVVFVAAAAIATHGSPSGMLRWLLHPGIGGPGDRSRGVGWGLSGLPDAILASPGKPSWLPGPIAGAAGVLQWILGFALVAFALARGLAVLGSRGCDRRARAVAGALLLQAVLAFVAAAGYQALRAEYFGLGFVPLAILAATGRGGRPLRGRAGIAMGVAVIAALLAWNLVADVSPSLGASRQRGRAVVAIERAIPPGAQVYTSLLVAARLANDGIRATTAWIALSRHPQEGAPKLGLDPIIASMPDRAVYVSTRGLDLLPPQAEAVGETSDEIWYDLRLVYGMRPVLRFTTSAGPETLYRLTRRGRGSR